MLKIKIQQGWVLKRVLAVVANMGPTALMEILPTGLLFRVTNPAQDVSTILGINTAAFHHYSCDEALVFEVNLQQFSSIINSATDDEDITICRSYDTPNLVSFVFVNNQNNEDNRNIELEVAKVEKDHWSAGDELMHEFKVCIRCEDLAHIMEHSKVNKEAITITMMGTMVTLNSGYETLHLKEERQECIIKNVPAGTRQHLQLSVNRLDSFLLVCRTTNIVWIHDSNSRSPIRPLLEFPLGDLGRLLIFLPQPFIIS
ncbi:uncharacterized protein [Spinacia oleracea]|uniref:Proliferating cell nuclear antigen PCNA N-terminal domain-containing protein n=1 Tax=Spinacia oleracea TaxID=3562 RepID=A0ABM3QSI9_SPIOL|nr:uncharacterized protein LOC130462026 [Spinacia oleracea]